MIHSMTSQHSSSMVSTPTGECMPHPFQNMESGKICFPDFFWLREFQFELILVADANALTYSDAVKLPIQVSFLLNL